MKAIRIYYTPEFQKLWRRVSKDVQAKAIKKEKIFRSDPYHPSLKTHKLKGTLEGNYSFSVDYHYRIVFFLQNGNFYFIAIGTHEIYK